ncbi:MAG: prenyltransferase/squalene oxidase repeat-containing protein [bacterium]
MKSLSFKLVFTIVLIGGLLIGLSAQAETASSTVDTVEQTPVQQQEQKTEQESTESGFELEAESENVIVEEITLVIESNTNTTTDDVVLIDNQTAETSATSTVDIIVPTATPLEIVTTTIISTSTNPESATTTLETSINTSTALSVTTTIDLQTLTTPTATSTPSTASTESSTSTEPVTESLASYGVGGSQEDSSADTTPTTTPETISNAEIQSAVDKIIKYMESQQTDDGKIIDGGITDWALMSFVADGKNPAEIASSPSAPHNDSDKTLLGAIISYDFTDPNDLNLCATYPRHVLALYTAGVETSSSSIQNLLTKIRTECYVDNDYGQSGINDDVFALMALLIENQTTDQEIIQGIIKDIKADQTNDGAFTWDGWPGADITGAVINTLNYAKSKGLIIDQTIFDNAKTYLKSQQLDDGGWGWGSSDVLTTGWVMMGINSLSETQSDWFKGEKNPWHVLVDNLNNDGYYESAWVPGTADWFAVKHAIPALLGQSWPIEPKFNQEITQLPNNPNPGTHGSAGGSDIGIDTASSTTDNTSATTTLEIASSTPLAVDKIVVINVNTTTSYQAEVEDIKEGSFAYAQDDNKNAQDDGEGTTGLLRRSAPRNDSESTLARNDSESTATKTLKTEQKINAGQEPKQNLTEKIIEQAPLDTPTRKTAKKAMVVSGGSALILGLYLGFKLLKNML